VEIISVPMWMPVRQLLLITCELTLVWYTSNGSEGCYGTKDHEFTSCPAKCPAGKSQYPDVYFLHNLCDCLMT
jgi:hypothetical protein